MKEKYWFSILKVTYWRMELLAYCIYRYSKICNDHPGFKRIWIFRKIHLNMLKRYQKLMWRRDIIVPKCENLYWRWLEKPFLIK